MYIVSQLCSPKNTPTGDIFLTLEVCMYVYIVCMRAYMHVGPVYHYESLHFCRIKCIKTIIIILCMHVYIHPY